MVEQNDTLAPQATLQYVPMSVLSGVKETESSFQYKTHMDE